MKRIRRIALLVAMALMLTFIVASAAYAATEVGTNGPDRQIGTDRSDVVYGLNGRDDLRGKPGPDELYAGKGIDNAFGNRGADYIVGGTGYDQLYGDKGNDRIEAADGREDYVDCGAGINDRASVDKADTVQNCETVNGP